MIYKSQVTVRYAETDRMGITHHAVYPIWFEEARSEWIKAQSGMSYGDVEKLGIMLPLTELNCKYYGTCDYMDVLTIHTSITRLTAARMVFNYKVFKEDKLITEGISHHAWVDSKTFRPVNIRTTQPKLHKIMFDAMEKE